MLFIIQKAGKERNTKIARDNYTNSRVFETSFIWRPDVFKCGFAVFLFSAGNVCTHK